MRMSEVIKAQQDRRLVQEQREYIAQMTTEQVDRFIELSEQLAPYRLLDKEYEELKKVLQTIATNTHAAYEPAELHGNTGRVVFSPQEDQTVINHDGAVGALIRKLGLHGFLATVRLTLGDLDEHLGAEAQQYLSKDPATGVRKLKAVIKDRT